MTASPGVDHRPTGSKTIEAPRIVVAAPRGKGGKTLATMALLLALSERGFKVTAFKNGPDFIDPSHHSAVAGTPSRNLDYVLMGGPSIQERCYRYSVGCDVALIEGNHGLYDSPDGRTEPGSTAHLAKLLQASVVLVIDGERANRTIGALVRGLCAFDSEVRLSAAILTNLVPRQFDRLTAIVEAEGVPVIGLLPRDEALAAAMPYRHLGLVPAEERASADLVPLLRERCVPRIDIPRLLELARRDSPPLLVRIPAESPEPPPRRARIGFLAGRPFTFYYPEMLERASQLGTVVRIDPETEGALPALDLLVIGGGFPEVYAAALERNRPLRAAVRQFAERGGRIYAECGGLMYLTRSITTAAGTFEMVGFLEGRTEQGTRPVAHGYATARVVRDSLIAPKGTVLRGHEFHYSRVALDRPYDLALAYERGVGLADGRDGIEAQNVYAHYLHLHPETYSVLDALLGPEAGRSGSPTATEPAPGTRGP